MPVFGVPFRKTPLDLTACFGRSAATILEVGFGMGETTAEIAAAHPEQNYLGVEVHTPGVGALLKLLEARGLTNVRIIEHDAQEVIDDQIPDQSLTGVHIFFPDPWPKVRHHKRRLIQQQFIHKLAARLLPGGYLHLATDWPDYAEQMLDAVDSTPGLVRTIDTEAGSETGNASLPADPDVIAPSRVYPRPVTKFEKRGIRLGHSIADIIALKTQRGLATD